MAWKDFLDAGQVCAYNAWPCKFLDAKERARKENPMKNAIRLVVLMLGLVTTYVALAAPMLAAPDGGPMPTCNPKTGCGPGK